MKNLPLLTSPDRGWALIQSEAYQITLRSFNGKQNNSVKQGYYSMSVSFPSESVQDQSELHYFELFPMGELEGTALKLKLLILSSVQKLDKTSEHSIFSPFQRELEGTALK